MRVRERRGFPVRKKCSNHVRSDCFHAVVRAAMPFPGGPVALAPPVVPPVTAPIKASVAPGEALFAPDTAVESEAVAAGRGVNRTFTKGEIIPIVIPLESAKPNMRNAVRISRPR